MSKLLLPEDFSKEIFNFSQKFTGKLRKQQKGNFREIIRGTILSGSSFLARIAEANSKKNNSRKDVERLSKTLSKIDVQEMADIHINSKLHQFRDEPVLILSDGGDMQKPFAKKMEKVCGNVDGSNGHKVGRGYFMHAMLAYGLESGNKSVLSNHLYSTKTEDFKSEWDEERMMFDKLGDFVRSSSYDRIIVEDRGCDDEKRFKYFIKELWCNFVTRIHVGGKSRNLILKDIDGNEESISVQALGGSLQNSAGSEREWYNRKLKKKLKSKIIYRKVYLPSMKDVPLYAIFCYTDGYDQPLVILTDLEVTNPEDAWKYFFYYKKRWEVENYYRGIKQSFGAEEFKIQDYESIQALIFMIMLVYDLLLTLKRKVKEFLGIILQVFQDFCRRKQKKDDHHLSLLAFLREEFVFLNPYGHYRFCSLKFSRFRYHSTKNQPSLLNFSEKW
jgi:hypothetical protein